MLIGFDCEILRFAQDDGVPMYLLLRWFLNTLALFVIVQVVPGFHADSWMTLAVAALILGLLNAIIKPILFVLTLPITILTLGLFLIVLNGIMLELTAWLVRGFRIDRLEERRSRRLGESPEDRRALGERLRGHPRLRDGAEQVSGGRAAAALHRAS